MNRLTKAWLALTVALLMAGCRADALAEADGRIVWDADGRAFMVRPGFGDTSFVRRVPDADKGKVR